MRNEQEVSVKDAFLEHAKSNWYFVRPGGNWGDYLIYEGAERLAERLQLNWRLVNYDELASLSLNENDCIYLHGGGAFNSWCSDKPFIGLRNAVNQPVAKVVQGPVTFEDNSEAMVNRISPIIERLTCQKLVFFVREKQSYNLAKSIFKDVESTTVALDHDTAFQLTPADLLDIAGLSKMPIGRYELNVDRQDNEAPSKQGNKLSLGRVYMDPATEASSFEQWVKIHLYAKAINSNRLHSAIVGAIAGKPVVVGAGSYHKNRSVWEYSLESKGVAWRDREFDVPAMNFWLPIAFRQSFKVRKVFRAINRVPVTLSIGRSKIDLNN